MSPDIPLYCDHCGFQLDYEVKCGTPFPPECENGCRDGYGNKVKMKLRKGGRQKQPEPPLELGELVLAQSQLPSFEFGNGGSIATETWIVSHVASFREDALGRPHSVFPFLFSYDTKVKEEDERGGVVEVLYRPSLTPVTECKPPLRKL